MSKVMLVEDDNNLREIYEARLQAEGYDIVTASDGEQALVVAKAERPELVISDVMMPKISGFEMLDILRNTEGLKDVKVIMLTALGQSDDQQRANKLGADRYLVKSQVTLEDIVKASHELLDDTTEATPNAVPPAPATEPVISQPAVSGKVVNEPVAAPAEPVSVTATPPIPSDTTAATPATTVSTPSVTPVASPVTPAAAPAEPLHTPPTATTAQPTTPMPAAPMAEPVAANEQPTAAPTPLPAAAPAPVVSTNDVQSTAQEEASMETKIEDFVAGASSDATPPAVAETVASTAPTASTDDKLVSDAVNNLISNTTPTTPAADPVATSSQPIAEPAVVTNTADPVPPTVNAAADSTNPVADDDQTVSDGGTVANKKVIQPLETTNKPDINELLVLEEAKQNGQSEVVAPQAVISNNEGVPTTENLDVASNGDTKNDGPAPDPNSIAL